MCRLVYRMAAILGLSVGLVVVQPFTLQAQTNTWTPAKRLGRGWWNSTTVDLEGRAHIGWYDAIANEAVQGHDLLMYVSRDRNGNWSDPNDVIYSGDGGYTVRNAMGVSSNGILFAFYRDFVAHVFAYAPARAAENGANWSSPVELFASAYYPDMLVDSHDVIHVLSSTGTSITSTDENPSELHTCAFCFDLFYRRSDDQGRSWSLPYPISNIPDSGSDRPQIKQGASGRLYISWEEGPDWYHGRFGWAAQDVRIRYSEDGGLTWSEPIILDGGNHPEKKPIQIAMTEIDDRQMMAVWRFNSSEDQNIYFQISNDLGSAWTSPQPIPNIFARSITDPPLDHYALLTDHLKVVHLFAVGMDDPKINTKPALYHIEYRNGLWGLPEIVYFDPQRRPEWPAPAIGSQNEIHLTWFTRGPALNLSSLAQTSSNSGDESLANLEVWYSYLPGNLPPQPTQTFRPTLTPLPTAVVELALNPTMTPYPTVQPVREIVAAKTRDLYAIENIIGSISVVGLFCAVVVGLYRSMRR